MAIVSQIPASKTPLSGKLLKKKTRLQESNIHDRSLLAEVAQGRYRLGSPSLVVKQRPKTTTRDSGSIATQSPTDFGGAQVKTGSPYDVRRPGGLEKSRAYELSEYFNKIGAPKKDSIFSTSAAELFQKGTLDPKTGKYSGGFKAPTDVAGLGPDYFSTQKEGLKEQLRQEFFGPLGQFQQAASGESAAGRLGSGVGKTIIQEAAAKPFAQSAAQIDRDVMQAELGERARVQEFNAQQKTQYRGLIATLQQADSANALQASQANAQLKQQYSDLAARIYDATNNRRSTENIAQLEGEVRAYEAALDFQAEYQQALNQENQTKINWYTARGQFKPSSPSQFASAEDIDSSIGIPNRAPQPSTGRYDTKPGEALDDRGLPVYAKDGTVAKDIYGQRKIRRGSNWISY